MPKKNFVASNLPLAQIVAVVMLAWALVPSNPYSYYLLLRIVLFGICAYLAFRFYERNAIGWVWTLGILAAVYNPIFRVHLTREIWTVVNLVTIAILIATIWAVPRRANNS